MAETFPEHLKREKAGKGHGHRIAYRWQGHEPYILDKPITWLTEEEPIGLVAARGFLRENGIDQDPTNTDLCACDLLAGAIDRLLNRAGVQVQEAAETLARHKAAPQAPTPSPSPAMRSSRGSTSRRTSSWQSA